MGAFKQKERKIMYKNIEKAFQDYEKDFIKRLSKEIIRLNSISKDNKYSSLAGMGVCVFTLNDEILNDDTNHILIKFENEFDYLVKNYNYYMTWDIIE